MRSDHEDGRGGRRWASVGTALLVLVVLVLVIAEATDRSDPAAGPPVTAVPLPATTIDGNTTSTSSPTTSTTLGVEFPELSGVVPGVTGTLHALVGDSNRQLIEIPAEADETLLRPDSEALGFVNGFGFDASGTLLAFLDGGEDGSGSDRLNVWSDTSRFGFGDIGVASYQWHETRSRSIAAITVDATGHAALRTFEFDANSLVAGIDTVADMDVSESLVAWGDYGFVVTYYDPQSEVDVTTLLDQEGNVIWRRSEITVLDASADEILVQFGNGKHYVVESGDPDAARLLTSLPVDDTVTGSDFSPDGRLAVHYYPLDGRDWNLRVYEADFDTFTDFVLEGWRVWDLEWSADGRFILMPGTDDAGGHVVIFYDTVAAEMYLFYFTTWVQWADLN